MVAAACEAASVRHPISQRNDPEMKRLIAFALLFALIGGACAQVDDQAEAVDAAAGDASGSTDSEGAVNPADGQSEEVGSDDRAEGISATDDSGDDSDDGAGDSSDDSDAVPGDGPEDTAESDTPQIEGDPAPDFTLALGDGGSYTLSEGAKPVYMVFWAEW